jgi:N-acetylmuramoyl-L-alanine amidase
VASNWSDARSRIVPFTDLPDRVVLALLVYGESRGEPVEGQIAVASVVRNRVKNRQQGWKDVCLAPDQFSCFDADDPNYPTLQRAAVILMTQPLVPDLAQAQWIADGIMAGSCKDNTQGSLNYLTTRLLEHDPPKWARNKPVAAVIGHHSFLTA